MRKLCIVVFSLSLENLDLMRCYKIPCSNLDRVFVTLLLYSPRPAAGSCPGDVLFLEGGAPSTSPDKQIKSDHWKKIGAGLRVSPGGRAAFNGRALVTAAGPVTLPPEIADGSEIH